MLTLYDATREYLSNLAVGHSPRTVKSYQNDLKRLWEFLTLRSSSVCQDVATLTVEDLIKFVQWGAGRQGMKSERVVKSTLLHYMIAASEFFRWCVINCRVVCSVSDLERLRETLRQYRWGYTRPLPIVSQNAIDKLIQTARRWHSPEEQTTRQAMRRVTLLRLRDIAILETLRSSGMRVGELVKLTRDDFDYGGQMSVRVTGKGNKQRVVFFDSKTWRALNKYWRTRGDIHHRETWRKMPAFAMHGRRAGRDEMPMVPIGTSTVRMVIDNLEHRAGIEKHLTPHSFRHAFATKVLEATGNLAAVQDLLGHASPETTRIYAQLSDRKKREAHRLAFAPPGRSTEATPMTTAPAGVAGERAPQAEGSGATFKTCRCWHPDFDHDENGHCGLCGCEKFQEMSDDRDALADLKGYAIETSETILPGNFWIGARNGNGAGNTSKDDEGGNHVHSGNASET